MESCLPGVCIPPHLASSHHGPDLPGKGHQLSRAVFIHTVYLVSNIECSW